MFILLTITPRQAAALCQPVGNFTANANFYGAAVAVSGSAMVIGTVGRLVYYYRLEGATGTLLFTISPTTSVVAFGERLAIDGRNIIITDEEYDGSAYFFRVSDDGLSAQQVQKLTVTHSGPNENFGRDTAISGRSFVVSKRYDTSDHQGTVYLYLINESGTQAEQVATIRATPSSSTANQFGWSVALTGDCLLVGAIGESAVYVFHITPDLRNAVQTARFTSDTHTASSYFGVSVAMSGNRILVGAAGEDSSRGAAYVFDLNANVATQVARISVTDSDTNDLFGDAVAISDDRILIGTSRSGRAYVFQINPDDSVEQIGGRLVAGTQRQYGDGSLFVAFNGSNILVGSPQDNAVTVFKGCFACSPGA